MASRRRLELWFPEAHWQEFANWPAMDTSHWPERKRAAFDSRCTALRLFLGGASVAAIRQQTGICAPELYRLVQRCAVVMPDGDIAGLRGLEPGRHLPAVPAARRPATARSGQGLFQSLLHRHPSLAEHIRKELIKQLRRARGEPSATPFHHLHQSFLDRCRALGVTEEQYPLNTQRRGYNALLRYANSLSDEIADRVVRATGDSAARGKWQRTRNGSPRRVAPRPFASVQLDGHKLDVRATVEIDHPDGHTLDVVLERFWILVLLECASRCVLSYAICYGREYAATDVLECILQSYVPWQPVEFTIPGLAYRTDAGFPSGVITACRNAGFDRIELDNAQAHRARLVRERLQDVVQCVLNLGPSGDPDARARVERVIREVARHIQQLPSTTGNRPGDRRGKGAEKTASALRVRASHIEELVEVLIANYNATPHGNTGRSPLDELRHLTGQDTRILRTISRDGDALPALFTMRVPRTVRGNLKEGHRPFVCYEQANYQNDLLAGMPSLIGADLILRVNVKDLRHIEAFLPDGSSIGKLRAAGRWGVEIHSLRTRKAINKARREGRIRVGRYDNPVAVYREYLANEARKRKRAAGELQQLKQEQGMLHPEHDAEHLDIHHADTGAEEPQWHPRRGPWVKIT